MRVLSLNLNGIRSATRKGLWGVMHDLGADIMCFQELKAGHKAIPELPDGYSSLWHPAQKPGYSGVGIMSRAAWDRQTVGMDDPEFDLEGRVLRTDFGDLSLVSIYVPSGTSGEARLAYKFKFLSAFRDYTRRLMAEGRRLLICGDFNIAHRRIDLKNWRANQKNSGFLPEERDWLSRYLGLGLIDAHREHIGPDTASYSWWSLRSGARARNVGWRLDYQLSTPEVAKTLRTSFIPSEPFLSDHAPVVMDYDLTLS